MRPRLVGLLAIACCLGVGPLASGQESTAELRGRVLDAQDAPVPGTTITITNQATGVVRQTVSTDDGSYFITAISPGSYELAAELAGFLRNTADETSGSTSDARRQSMCSCASVP
jgi:Carboxypeptidase regulatory-like domain